MGCNFNIDDLDFFIIQNIASGKKRVWDITKDYFKDEITLADKGGKVLLERVKSSKFNTTKTRLKKMQGWGLVIISKEENGWNKYDIILENFKIGKHKFPDGYFDSIQLKINDSWVVFQL